MTRLQKIGGAAGVVLAIAIAAELALFLVVVPSIGSSVSDVSDPAKYAKLLARGQTPFVTEGIFFVVATAFAIALVRALAVRGVRDSSEMNAVGATFGYIGFSFLMATFGVRVYLALDPAHAEQAIPTLTILSNALSGVGGLLLGVWVATVSGSAIRSRTLPRSLALYGFVVAIALMLSGLIAEPVFIPLLLVWSLWIGVVLLTQADGVARMVEDRASASMRAAAPRA
jgi:hypothetical protein